jgi:hypothetical protein
MKLASGLGNVFASRREVLPMEQKKKTLREKNKARQEKPTSSAQ